LVCGPWHEGQLSLVELRDELICAILLNFFVSNDGLDGGIRIVHQKLVYRLDLLLSLRLDWALTHSISGLREHLLIDKHHQVFLAARLHSVVLLLCPLHYLRVRLGLRKDLAGLLLGVQVDGGLRGALFVINNSKKVQRVLWLLVLLRG
jgi:small basic protein